MSRTEIRITGYGGQGVILCGHIIGKAAAINANQHATQIQSFGPEARGSACSTTLVVSDKEILYPYIESPDFLVAMSAEGYEKHRNELKKDGVLIYASDLVTPAADDKHPAYGVPATTIAESLGRSLVQNIVMLGFITAVMKLVPKDLMCEAVKDSVPPGTEDLNLKAFEAGWAEYDRQYGAQAQA